MMKKCLYCNNELQQVAQKLICISDDCSFQCKIEDYDHINEPWGEKISNNNELWNYEVLEKFPYMIAVEYKRLHSLAKDNKLYGVMFQIKDFFELLLKFPVLLLLSRYCDNQKRNEQQSEIIRFLLENKLSLGSWKSIADKCLNIEDSSSIVNILRGIVKLYNENSITTWRNNTIGHGVLKFDDNEEFRNDIENKLLLIKKYLDEFSCEYNNLNFGYMNKRNKCRLQGINPNLKNLTNNSNLYFYYEDKFVQLNNLIVIHENEIYFFDSYFKDKKKTKMLNYISAKEFQKKIKYFDELFKNINKEVKLNTLGESSLLSDDIYMSDEEELFNQIDTPDQIIKPKYIYDWFNNNIQNNDKGVFLLRMEEGMGKTVFSRLLDPHSNLSGTSINKKFLINDATIRTYYINNMYSYKINVFRNNLIDILKYDNKHKGYIKGDLPNFRKKDIQKKKLEFVEILNKFKDIYKRKFATNKLILILDGLDEINISEKETILDYIPTSEMLSEGIYILLTARNSDNSKGNIYAEIEKIKTDNTLVIDRKNQEYVNNLKTFLCDKCGVRTKELEKILKIVDNKFLYVKPIRYVLKYREISNLNGKNTDFFKEFIDIVKELYTEKYSNRFIKVLLIIAISRKSLTIDDISYMLSSEKPDFKFISYLSDATCLLTKERSYRGDTIGILHSKLRSYLLENYKILLKDMSTEWLNEVIESNKNYSNVRGGQLYLIFNSLYIAKMYNKSYIDKIINKLSINEISKYFSMDKKRYEYELLITFCNDYIDIIEEEIQDKGSKKKLSKLIDMYIYKINLNLNYSINSEVTYIKDINRVFDLLKIYNQNDVKLLIKAYELRSNYYRKIGNVKKSMDDINIMSKLISNFEETNISSYEVSNVVKSNIMLQKAINLKNLERIDEALEVSDEAFKLIENDTDIGAIANKANILNNIGLCYRTKDNLDMAKDYILKAINLSESIKDDKELYNSIIYVKYANLGQILRRQGYIKDALEIYNQTIGKLEEQEINGYIISKNDKSMLYNARANIYWDFGNERNDKKYYEIALDDYILSERIVDSINKDNKDMIFLSRIYSNIAKLYKNFLDDDDNAQKYIDKYNEIKREVFKKQLDIDQVDDDELDKGILLNSIQANINRGEDSFIKKRWKDATKYYEEALEILKSSEYQDEFDDIKANLYYNMATSKKNQLQDKVNLNLVLKARLINVNENYDEFNPHQIIRDFLEADKCIMNTDEEKGSIYSQISYVYCEAIKDYETSKIYAEKSIKLGSEIGHLMLGNCYFEEGYYEEAIKSYKNISSKHPDYITAQRNIEAAELRKNI
ncbi:tetratricopeptide repeat protein [Clostridium botulinum]|nr:tetratricopeptide repeat protein [Clostridium botulinum]